MNISKTRNSELVNSYIEEYLDYYCSLTIPPGYAILLKGNWGTGKTWFINQYIKDNQTDNKFLYVSLYGISELSDIEYAFFQQLHPIMSSKEMALVGRCLKGMLKLSLKIDLDNDGKDDGSASLQIPDLKLSEEFANIDKCILVFDDIERCALDIKQILGYINYFVEQKNLKVILVTDEEKISNIDEYLIIKEKLIGKTFSVSHAINDVLLNFISEFPKENYRQFQDKNLNIIKSVFSESGSKNLRYLKQIILDYDRIYEKLTNNVKDNQQALSSLLKALVLLSVELKSTSFTSDEIFEVLKKYSEFYYPVIYDDNEGNERTKDSLSNWELEVFKKYSFFKGDTFFPNLKWWQDFFDTGLIDLNELDESINSSKYFQDENTLDWIKLWHYSDLSDDEFPILLKEVSDKLWGYKYIDIGEICHVVGLLLYFSDAKLYQMEKEEILKKSKQCVSYMSEKCLLDFGPLQNMHSNYGSYKSLGILAKESKEYSDFRIYVSYIYELFLDKKMKDVAQDIPKIIKEDIWKFMFMICRDSIYFSEESLTTYYDKTILNYVDPKLFVNSLLQISSSDKLVFFQSLPSRYDSQKNKLKDELEWLKNIQRLLKHEADKKVGKVSSYTLNKYIQDYLEPIIRGLEE